MSLQSVDNLESLGRRQLQQLCKNFGIKANKKNVELIASLREIMEVQALANETSAGSCQGIVTGNQDSSLVEESSIQSSPKALQCPAKLLDSQKAPPEMNQLSTSQNSSLHPSNIKERVVPMKDLDVDDEHAVLWTRKCLGMSAVGEAKDHQHHDCLAVGGTTAELPQVGSSDEWKNERDGQTKRKRDGTDETPPEVSSLHVAQSVGDTTAEVSSEDSKTDREPPTKRKRKGTYEIPPEVSSLHIVQDPTAITYPVQPGKGDMKEEILKEICQRVAQRREIGDVPSNKVDENVHSPFQGKVPQKVQKNRRSWSKVHAKLFQKMESIDDYSRRKIMAKKGNAMTAKGSRIPISKTSNMGRQKENSPQAPKTGVFRFGPTKEVKPGGMPFDIAASLKRPPRSYTPYKGPVPKFVS